MHGPDAFVEEIPDWRPYDYVTDRTILDTPSGEVGFPHTIEFEPIPDGTLIHYRFALPETEAEGALAREIASAYGEALRSAVPALVAQLEAEGASHTTLR